MDCFRKWCAFVVLYKCYLSGMNVIQFFFLWQTFLSHIFERKQIVMPLTSSEKKNKQEKSKIQVCANVHSYEMKKKKKRKKALYNVYYFICTISFDIHRALWRIRFASSHWPRESVNWSLANTHRNPEFLWSRILRMSDMWPWLWSPRLIYRAILFHFKQILERLSLCIKCEIFHFILFKENASHLCTAQTGSTFSRTFHLQRFSIHIATIITSNEFIDDAEHKITRTFFVFSLIRNASVKKYWFFSPFTCSYVRSCGFVHLYLYIYIMWRWRLFEMKVGAGDACNLCLALSWV